MQSFLRGLPSLKLKLYFAILSSSHSLSYPQYICIKSRRVFFTNAAAKSAANINHVLPAIALFLLCLALYPESQQPLSESTDKPAGEQWKVKKISLHFTLSVSESADTNRVSRLCWNKLAEEAVLLAEPLVFVSLHRPHVLQVDCRRKAAWREKTGQRSMDRFTRWLCSTLARLTVTYLDVNRKDNCLHSR